MHLLPHDDNNDAQTNISVKKKYKQNQRALTQKYIQIMQLMYPPLSRKS